MASDEKWVKKYESYKAMDLDTAILKKEEKGEDASKLKAVKANLPKIENLKEFLDKKIAERGKLEEEKNLIEKLKEAPKVMQDMDTKIKEIEGQNKQIESKIADIDNQLQKGVKNPDEKNKLEEDKKKLWDEYGINQGKMGKYQAEYTKNERLVQDNLGKKFHSLESIDSKLEETNKTIDKCNTICEGLVEGENISDIIKSFNEKENAETIKPETTKFEPTKPETRAETETPDKEKEEEEKSDEARPRDEKIEGKENKEKTDEKEEYKKPEKKKLSLKERIALAFKKVKDLYNKVFKKEDVTKELKEAEKEVEEEKTSTFKDDIRVDTSVEPEKENKEEELLDKIAKVVDAEKHEKAAEKIQEETKDGIKDEIKDDKVKEEKEPAKNNLDELENSYLMAVAEHGEKSAEANKIASEIKLRRHVMKESGVEIGSKKDMTTTKEIYTPLPQDGKLTAALKAQEQVNDDEGR